MMAAVPIVNVRVYIGLLNSTKLKLNETHNVTDDNTSIYKSIVCPSR